jgi:23S rRNA (cytidine1920-2'-O)/16S rRNA (cytidine1409-2'-O)-methyltransferase
MTAARFRLDQWLVLQKLFESRAQAGHAIEAGCVMVDGRTATKAAQRVIGTERIVATAPHPYVSRGGVKLEAALKSFAIDVKSRIALDVGASTGGFTDCLLQHGAERIYAIDVGEGQLHPQLRADHRVMAREKTDIRLVEPGALQPMPTIAVMDVSFISATTVLDHVCRLLARPAELIVLVKPQFELERSALKKGIVRSEEARQTALQRVLDAMKSAGLFDLRTMPSPITGGDGNVEFLVHAKRS